LSKVVDIKKGARTYEVGIDAQKAAIEIVRVLWPVPQNDARIQVRTRHLLGRGCAGRSGASGKPGAGGKIASGAGGHSRGVSAAELGGRLLRPDRTLPISAQPWHQWVHGVEGSLLSKANSDSIDR
jgi:hypothetical protein